MQFAFMMIEVGLMDFEYLRIKTNSIKCLVCVESWIFWAIRLVILL